LDVSLHVDIVYYTRGMDKPGDISILFCKHASFTDVRGDIVSHICSGINKVIPNQALGAQKYRALWMIGVKSNQAKQTLLQTSIMVNNNPVKLYEENPFDLRPRRIEGERVVFKDIPLWEPNELITDYLKSVPNVETFSDVFLSRARDHITGKTTEFVNGDRYVFMKVNPAHPLPDRCLLRGYPVRIWYATRNIQCKRCFKIGHKTEDTSCPLYIEALPDNYHVFRNGTFSNFNPTPVTLNSTTYLTSEHAYQWRACTEHLREDLAEKVVKAKYPAEAKRIAYEVKQKGSTWDDIKYGVMKEVLIAKLASSKEFRDELLLSDNKVLVEGLSDPFWGCGLPYNIAITTNPDQYPGKNNLGKLLMELRADMMANPSNHPFIGAPLDTDPRAERSRPILKVGACHQTINHPK